MFTDYYSTVGFIRSMESQVLRKGHVDQMLDASSSAEAYLILNDTDYSESVNEYSDVNDYEKMIERALLQTKNRLNRSVVDKQVVDMLWFYYDIYNAKIALKAMLQNKSFEDIVHLLSPYGSIDKTKIRDFAFSNLFLPQFPLAKVQAEKIYATSNNVRFVDVIFDAIFFKKLLGFSKMTQSPVLRKYAKKWIDINNIQTAFRLTAEEKQVVKSFVFIPGGNISKNQFHGSLDEVKSLTISMFNVDESAFNEAQSRNTFSLLEKELDKTLHSFIESSHYIANGPEPIMAYWWKKIRSSEVLRAVLIGKMNNLHNEITRKNLKKLY
jgi:vacuolar-type H+-ATPase subunit C/Vma6